MKRAWPIIATIAALTAACLASAPAKAQSASPTQPPIHQVTLVLAPYLTWGDISPTSTPTLWRLAQTGALASVNARSRVRQPGQGATPLEGALAGVIAYRFIGFWLPTIPAAWALITLPALGRTLEADRDAFAAGRAGAVEAG